MKRKAAILALVLVVVLTLAVVLTACNGVKNTAKLTEGLEADVTRTVVNDRLSAISGDITSAQINGYGVVMWQDYDTSAGYTYYYLPLGSSSPITSRTSFYSVGGGIYRTGNPTDGYSYYDANGYLRDSDTSDAYNDGKLTFSDGTVYNVVKGVAIADNDPFSVSYEEAGTADIVTSNYRIVDLSLIYDKSGSFVRSVNIYSLFEIPVTVADVTYWTIEDYVYVQYTYSLPDDAKKYDCYVASEGKLGIVTMRYDIKKDKVKEFKNFDYVVTNAFSSLTDLATGDRMRPADYAVLTVSEINKEKQVSMPVVQTFKKNLGIYVNLQTLMPGATGISLYGDNVILKSDTGETAVFDGKDEIASFIPADSLTSANDGQAYRYGNNFYNYAGGHVYTLGPDEELLHNSIDDSISENGVLWVRDNSSASSMTVKAINLANNSTTSYTVAYSVYESLSGNFNYLPVVNGSAVDVIDMNTGNVIISGISDTASLYVSSNGDYRLIRVTENGVTEFYRYGIVEKEA
ncbi:MAG TPA: hypothetical protein IAC73_05780 [Candidatus Limadaptatus stercoripullorum]|uniref:Lipoprotein n=1 Tax=Candidatus Limadaptatus stercoripullorum TaxID=2840846 RepID=A0A9D1SW66_9FIRM|nr:hypothetical protein [Candidatus Limadaptatus stercoripullorum]